MHEHREAAKNTLAHMQVAHAQRALVTRSLAVQSSQPSDGATKKETKPRRFIYNCKKTGEEDKKITGAAIEMKEGDTAKASHDIQSSELYNNFGFILKFYLEVFGRNSIDDKGCDLIGFVNFRSDTAPKDPFLNAQWTYGEIEVDGTVVTTVGAIQTGETVLLLPDENPSNQQVGWTSALDIMGHECTHGVINMTPARLDPAGLNSGPLNESLADVFSTMIKQLWWSNRLAGFILVICGILWV